MSSKAPIPGSDSSRLALSDPAVLAYLPMLYVAWADSSLAPEEIRALAVRLSGDQGLGCACRDFWGLWMDPDRPPSAAALQEVLGEVRRVFLEQGYFEPAKAKAVRKLVGRLCAEIAPIAPALVDGFGIPEELLPAIVRA